MTKERFKAFTLVELMVVIGIIGLLMGILLPVFSGIREQGRQKACGQSMGSIGRGMLQYSGLVSESCVMLPLIADPNGTGTNPSVKISSITGTDDGNLPVADLGGQGSINAMQNFWPLIYRNMCGENHFQCPSDDGYKARQTIASGMAGGTAKRYGWVNMNNFSFGVQWCYPVDGNSNACDPTGVRMDEMAVIMADRNPGGAVSGASGSVIKPSNHPKDGENVMYRGSSVKFFSKTTDSKAGKEGDDIYVNNNNSISNGPIDKTTSGGEGTAAYDTIIVPAYDKDSKTGRAN